MNEGALLQERNTTLPPLAHRIVPAAQRLGISRSGLYGLIRGGAIQTIRIGGRVLVTETELQRVVEQAKQEAA